MNGTAPDILKIFFIMHFIIDILFALPLFFIPELMLTALGWINVDTITARMVSAALFGIGTESFLCRNSSTEVYISMLNLKIIWSFAAMSGLLIALVSGKFIYNIVGICLFITFFLFNTLWIFWRIKLKNNDSSDASTQL